MKAKRDSIAVIPRPWLRAVQWKPQALTAPVIDSNFQQMHELERVTEVLRYSIGKLEFWISPEGNLREWLRFNVAIAIVLSIPALLIVPVVTYLLGQFATWSALLVQIANNLLVFPIAGIIGIALLSA